MTGREGLVHQRDYGWSLSRSPNGVDTTDMKSISRIVLALILLVGAALPAAAARKEGVHLLTSTPAAVTAGTSSWIALNWTSTGGEASEFRVTSEGTRGVEVSYPENTGDHTSLYHNNLLSNAELDYTALKLTVPDDFRGKRVNLKLEVSYLWDGKHRTQTKRVRVPIVRYDGQQIAALTDHVGVIEAGSSKWVGLEYNAPGPSVENVKVQVDDSGLGDVTYPGQGEWSGLHNDSTLDGGETDLARFELDTTGMTGGEHTFVAVVTYDGGEMKHEVGVTVGK